MTDTIKTIKLADTIECWAHMNITPDAGVEWDCEYCEMPIRHGNSAVETSNVDDTFATDGEYYHTRCFAYLLAGWGITL